MALVSVAAQCSLNQYDSAAGARVCIRFPREPLDARNFLTSQ